MNIKEEILREHSKNQAQKVAAYIGKDKKRFSELMRLFLSENYRITQRSAWALSFCVDNCPDLFNPYIEEIVLNLKKDVSVAIRRNTVRILQKVDIPDEFLGITADACFHLLASKAEPIAVKAFSMTVLANICVRVPDLKHELKILIEDQLPYGSTGFKNRGNKTLKLLSTLPD